VGELISLRTAGDKSEQQKRFLEQSRTKQLAKGTLANEDVGSTNHASVGMEGGTPAAQSGSAVSLPLMLKQTLGMGGDTLDEVEPALHQTLNATTGNSSDGVDRKSEQQGTFTAATTTPLTAAGSAGCEASQQQPSIAVFSATSNVGVNVKKNHQTQALVTASSSTSGVSKQPIQLASATTAAAVTNRSTGVCTEKSEPNPPPTAYIATTMSWDESEPPPQTAAAATATTAASATHAAAAASAVAKLPMQDAVWPELAQAQGSRRSAVPAATAAGEFDVSELLREHERLFRVGGLGGDDGGGGGGMEARAGAGAGSGAVLAESSQAQVL
jgi:hypothetical protein